ncbi:MAG: DUF3047 domain-containing protein [Syntrophorhabdaceae bacterium]|nr:DUF3047 domain-containing protein [Syntrophorhabdaceae bacterium]
MRNHFLGRYISFFVFVALLVPVVSFSAEGLGHGWRRSGIGLWGEKPTIHEGASPNGIAVELVLPPGANVSYTRKGSWSSDNAAIQMSTDLVMPAGNEYRPSGARFPASVTFVYGKDKLSLGGWGRFKLFFVGLANGFRPSGIRLTYAWGTMLPVGSMYRLWEEETVFIMAGPEEAGKEISTARRVSEDFKAAYGRPPKGLVTEVIVEARNSSEAKTPAKTSITLKYPME